jgi:SlyX protein
LSGGLHLGVDGPIGELGADDGLEEGDGLVIAALLGQEGAERHAGTGEEDEILGLHGGVEGIAEGGLGELGPAALEQLTGALEVAEGIHGRRGTRQGTSQRRAGYPGGMEDESRLVELELRYMQQQEQLQELSEVLYAQQRELDVLKAELGQLKKKLEGEPGLVDARQHDKPPHY